MAESHEEVGVQVEAIARQSRLFRRATATDAWVSFDDRDFQTGPSQIGRKRESVMSGSDDDTIELFHSLLRTTASTLLHEPTLDHGVDAFVAVDELRHAQIAGHSDYFRKHLVLAAFGGGEGGIRTPDTVTRMPHFECGAFNHVATSPWPQGANILLVGGYVCNARRLNKNALSSTQRLIMSPRARGAGRRT